MPEVFFMQFDKNRFKKQLVSGGIYIALAAAVVTVTLSGVNGILGGSGYGIQDKDKTDNGLKLPETSILQKEQAKTDPFDSPYFEKETTVSDNASGISAEVHGKNGDAGSDLSGAEKDEKSSAADDHEKAEPMPKQGTAVPHYSDTSTSEPDDSLSVTSEPSGVIGVYPETEEEPLSASGEPEGVEYPTEPEETYYGFYCKPADGYIERQYSDNELLYSPTMGDYRTHDGIDITGDPGSPVRAIYGGVVESMYYDDFMGYTVVIDHKDGIRSVYSNLSEAVPNGLCVGKSVETGEVIGGIGNSAGCECADVYHLHLSITKDGKNIDPAAFLRSYGE